jgi:ammonium transporter Rh
MFLWNRSVAEQIKEEEDENEEEEEEEEQEFKDTITSIMPPSETTPLVVSSAMNGGDDDDEVVKPSSARRSNKSSSNLTMSTLLGTTQLLLIVLFAWGTTTYSPNKKDYSSPAEYIIFRDIMVMLLLGFGYLMTFLKNYGLGAVGLTLLLSALAIQLNVFCELFSRFLYKWISGGENEGDKDTSDDSEEDTVWPLPLTLVTLIDGEFAAATLLISFGAIIGRASPLQLVCMTICQAVAYALNKAVLVFGIISCEDVGGSMTIHMFGAYFGLAVSYVLGPPQASALSSNCKPNATSDLTALIGTTLLWVYWPSFVGATETGVSQNESLCVMHTILALLGSTGAAFFFSPRLSHHGDYKLDPVHIANSTLAGGVAVGSSARLCMTPVGALGLGFLAGTVSVHGYAYSTPALENCKCRIYDTCGVGNLHGWPSILGGLSSVVFVLLSSSSDSVVDFLVHGTGFTQCLAQVAGVLCTVIVAIVSGLVTGMIMKKAAGSDGDDVDEYDDAIWWEGEYFFDIHHHD